jgi:hypothetical protein
VMVARLEKDIGSGREFAKEDVGEPGKLAI